MLAAPSASEAAALAPSPDERWSPWERARTCDSEASTSATAAAVSSAPDESVSTPSAMERIDPSNPATAPVAPSTRERASVDFSRAAVEAALRTDTCRLSCPCSRRIDRRRRAALPATALRR